MVSPHFDPSGCSAACRTRPGATARRWAAATRRKSARAFRVTSLPPIEIGRLGGENSEIVGSGGQTLAALCPPRRQHPTPGRSRHACPEAVAALANEVARLVSALHGTGSE